MNHLNKDIVFGIRKSKLGVFSVVIAIMGACFLTGQSVAADQAGEQDTSPNTRARSDNL